MAEVTVGIVGAGIVGLAIGREVALRRPGVRVVVFEKEDRVAAHQTGHNSGVVHAGIYYAPGSLKARLCTRGAAMIREYCAERGLPFDECGKLVVAVDAEGVARMDVLAARAGDNHVPGLRRVGPREIGEIEPHCTGLAALYSPHTAITDYVRIARSFAADIVRAGGEIRTSFPVTRITETTDGIEVSSGTGKAGKTGNAGEPGGSGRGGRGGRPGKPGRAGGAGALPGSGSAEGTGRANGIEVSSGAEDPDRGDSEGVGTVRVDELIICAGVQSDLVAEKAGDVPGPRIVPFRGEYLLIRPEKAGLIRGLIYPVPDPRYPFLGVHFTRRVDGTVDIGPNAVLAFAREGYRFSDVSSRDLLQMARWGGTWRMAARHWRTGIKEMRGSLSKGAFMKAARLYVPEIGPADVYPGGSGVRAQALDRDGSLVEDFRIHRLGRITAVRNAPSPAATSSMAIAEYVLDTIGDGKKA